ncbi:MAG: hypothetical protein WA113_01595 [Desulfitobacteriaceae bacterium]
MATNFKSGFILLVLTIGYNLLCLFFFENMNADPAIIFGIMALIIWFVYGLWTRVGFFNGIVIGSIGGIGVISTLLLQSTHLQLVSFSLWGYPFLLSFESIRIKMDIPDSTYTLLATIIVSWVLSILVVAVGSLMGRKLSPHK